MKKQILYGMLGFLSLLGFAGVFTEARGFLGFFAFAVDFQYFFLKSDEMLEAQLPRSASRAFVVGMLMMAAAVLGTLTLGGFTPQRALLTRLHGWLGCLCGGLRPDRRLVRLPGELGAGAVIRNRMKEHRARLGLKQEELAKLVGVRRETIGNLEKGRYNPSLVLAWNIAKVFGVPIEEVFTVEPDGPAEHS